jgi:ABC-type multidrug transport system ATPase subunit
MIYCFDGKVMGPSGAGKSTFLDCIAKRTKFTSGHVRLVFHVSFVKKENLCLHP